MEAIKPYIPFLIPVVLIELGLMIFALTDLIRRERTKGPKWMWAILIVVVQIVGPVVYLLAGREEA
jgi:hypothetical protein